MKMTLHLCGLPPQNLQPQSNQERGGNQANSSGGTSTKYLTNTPPQTHRGHQEQGMSEKLSQPEAT